MLVIENQFNNLASVVNKIYDTISLENNSFIYGNFIFKQIKLDINNFYFRFIMPNKIAITILYSLKSKQILLYVKILIL